MKIQLTKMLVVDITVWDLKLIIPALTALLEIVAISLVATIAMGMQ
jgi:hypothetical protein